MRISVLFAILCVLILIVFGPTMLRELRMLIEFKPTSGEIITISLRLNRSDVIIPQVPTVSSAEFYYPEIRYSYKVNDREYRGQRHRLSTTGFPKEKAANIIRSYSPKSRVIVWYDPDNPSISVLEKKVSVFVWVLTSLGAIGLFTSTWCIMKRLQ